MKSRLFSLLLLSLICLGLAGCGTGSYLPGLAVRELIEASQEPTPTLSNSTDWKQFELPQKISGDVFVEKMKTIIAELGYQIEGVHGQMVSARKEEIRRPGEIGERTFRMVENKDIRIVIIKVQLAPNGHTVKIDIMTSDALEETDPRPIAGPFKQRLQQLTAAKS